MTSHLLADTRRATQNTARDLAMCLAGFAAGTVDASTVRIAADDHDARCRSYHAAIARIEP